MKNVSFILRKKRNGLFGQPDTRSQGGEECELNPHVPAHPENQEAALSKCCASIRDFTHAHEGSG